MDMPALRTVPCWRCSRAAKLCRRVQGGTTRLLGVSSRCAERLRPRQHGAVRHEVAVGGPVYRELRIAGSGGQRRDAVEVKGIARGDEVDIPLALPPGLQGLQVWFQHFVIDASAPTWFAHSNGLEFTIGS
jgi:hypothetical protein